MRFFLYSLLLTVALLVVFIEITSPMLQHKKTVHQLPVHKTLYLGHDIYDDQMLHIVAATMEWNQVTNGEVVFDIKKLPDPKINPNDAIIIMNVTEDTPETIVLDNLNEYSTLAFFNDEQILSYVGLVDDRIPDAEYDAVVMHELGHSLGLQHIQGIDGIGTLMCPTITLGAPHVTKEDLHQFCKLYHCDARKYHVVPEVQ
jgi:Matrixin